MLICIYMYKTKCLIWDPMCQFQTSDRGHREFKSGIYSTTWSGVLNLFRTMSNRNQLVIHWYCCESIISNHIGLKFLVSPSLTSRWLLMSLTRKDWTTRLQSSSQHEHVPLLLLQSSHGLLTKIVRKQYAQMLAKTTDGECIIRYSLYSFVYACATCKVSEHTSSMLWT